MLLLHHYLWRRLLPLLLLISYSPSLGLRVPHFPQVQPHGACPKWVRLRMPAVLLEGCPESTDQGVEAAPRLPERARARRRRMWVAVERASVCVDLRLPELVQVPEELQHVGSTAPRER